MECGDDLVGGGGNIYQKTGCLKVCVQEDQRVVGEFVWPITYPALLKSGCTNITGYGLFKGPAHEPCEEINLRMCAWCHKTIFFTFLIFFFFSFLMKK